MQSSVYVDAYRQSLVSLLSALQLFHHERFLQIVNQSASVVVLGMSEAARPEDVPLPVTYIS